MKLISGKNDLATTHPELLKEWDYEKNDILGIKPVEVSAGSGKKVWWKCSEGHEWQAVISNRTRNRGCPYCSNYKLLSGYNDLATTHPELLKEWDYEKNDKLGIKPTEISAGSNKKVWWKCSEGHEWQAIIAIRTTKNTKCPYCSNFKVLSGYNDLATTHPELLADWDYEKNDALRIKPTEISAGSNKKIWWKCRDCSYEWYTTMYSRTTDNTGCPKCYKLKQIVLGTNDLATTHPDLLKEWNYEKNINLCIVPTKVTLGSHKKVWWKCKNCGNEWQARIYNRTQGTGCPKCQNRSKK